MRKLNLAQTFGMILLFAIFSYAFSFGGPSPDTGTADFGTTLGTFAATSGNATDTRTDNNIYFALERSAGGAGAANQSLAFNVSFFSANASIKIIGINGSVRYCHARRATNICDGTGGAQIAQGISTNMNILIQNASSSNFTILRNLTATETNAEQILSWNLSSVNYSQFINATGFINLHFEFAWSGVGRSAFLNDHTNITISYDRAPYVFLESPANNTIVVTRNVSIFCNATDDFGLANISLFNSISGSFALNETHQAGGIFNRTNFNLTNVSDGVYVWTCLANDTVGLSSFGKNFTITFFSINLTPTGCSPSPINPAESTNCNATITTVQGAINAVKANVTLPNNTVIDAVVSNQGANYAFAFTQTALLGFYNVSWFANDTAGNNRTGTGQFSVGDTIPPNIILNTINGFNSSNYTIGMSFTASDNYNTSFTCSINVDGALNQTDTAVQNNSLTTFTVSGFNQSLHHNWSISCTDGALNSNTSDLRIFTIDVDAPEFNLLNYSPTNDDDLDPGVLINFTANVTDNTTDVVSVILQHKLSTQADFTNTTMDVISSNLFNASFVASDAGIYEVRLLATNTVGILGQSNQINISVQYDRTWTLTPSALPARLVNLSQNYTLGNITINNTGDFALNFTMSSDFANTRFNVTFPKELAAKEKAEVEINVTTPAVNGVTVVNINTAADPNAEPLSRTVQGTIVIAPNQPVLVSKFTGIPSTANLGNAIILSARLDNIGEGNATNVSFFITLPNDWSLIAGELNTSIINFSSGDVAFKTLEVRIPADSAAGNRTVIANSSGFNDTNGDIASLGLIIGESKLVEVRSVSHIGGGKSSSAAASAGGGAAAATGGKAAVAVATLRPTYLVRTLKTEEFISTFETVSLTRGEKEVFPLKISNVFENTTIFNVRINLEGYLSQYLSYSPDVLNDINYGESKVFMINVSSPAYRKKGVYNITVIIIGDAVVKDFIKEDYRTVEVNSIKHFTENRTVTLYIHEVKPEVATSEYVNARKYLQEMQDAGLGVKTASHLWSEIDTAYAQQDYGLVDVLANKLKTVYDDAFSSDKLLKSIEQKIVLAKKRGIDAFETEHILLLVKSAIEREDYALALQRLHDAELVQLVETKGVFNIFVFIKRFWWAIAIIVLAVSIVGVLSYRKLLLASIAQRVQDLAKEEVVIHELMRETQKKCFKDKTLSTVEYHKQMYQYEHRLEAIKRTISKLRTRRIILSTAEEEMVNLKKEDGEIDVLMKETQESYFVKGTMDRHKYLKRMDGCRARKAEIEEFIAVLEAKILMRTSERKKFAEKLKASITPGEIKKIMTSIRKASDNTKEKLHEGDEAAIVQVLEKYVENKKEKSPVDIVRAQEPALLKLKTASFASGRSQMIQSLKVAYEQNPDMALVFGVSENVADDVNDKNLHNFVAAPVGNITARKIEKISRKDMVSGLKKVFRE